MKPNKQQCDILNCMYKVQDGINKALISKNADPKYICLLMETQIALRKKFIKLEKGLTF